MAGWPPVGQPGWQRLGPRLLLVPSRAGTSAGGTTCPVSLPTLLLLILTLCVLELLPCQSYRESKGFWLMSQFHHQVCQHKDGPISTSRSPSTSTPVHRPATLVEGQERPREQVRQKKAEPPAPPPVPGQTPPQRLLRGLSASAQRAMQQLEFASGSSTAWHSPSHATATCSLKPRESIRTRFQSFQKRQLQ